MGVCSPGEGQQWGRVPMEGDSTVEQALCPVGSVAQHSSLRDSVAANCVQ